jgi:hypothetical protein
LTEGTGPVKHDVDRLRLLTQSVIAVLVLIGATFLAYQKIIDSGAVIALYGFAAGAVGAGSIGSGGVSGRTTQHFTNGKEGSVLTTERKD